MVDLFLSENLFTTIPKAVFGMAQVGGWEGGRKRGMHCVAECT